MDISHEFNSMTFLFSAIMSGAATLPWASGTWNDLVKSSKSALRWDIKNSMKSLVGFELIILFLLQMKYMYVKFCIDTYSVIVYII